MVNVILCHRQRCIDPHFPSIRCILLSTTQWTDQTKMNWSHSPHEPSPAQALFRSTPSEMSMSGRGRRSVLPLRHSWWIHITMSWRVEAGGLATMHWMALNSKRNLAFLNKIRTWRAALVYYTLRSRYQLPIALWNLTFWTSLLYSLLNYTYPFALHHFSTICCLISHNALIWN
jgi:hypothetical protein